MQHFKFITDTNGLIQHIETTLRGRELLTTMELNKGSAFNQEERCELHLLGRLPEAIETLEQQVAHFYAQYQECKTSLQKNVYLNGLYDRNMVAFYKLVSEHLVEMLPIVYTPTVGEAVKKYSLELRAPRGLYISYPQREQMDTILANRVHRDVDLVLVTDGEGVLGIGDQGVGGMDISIGKLMVYTLCSGLNPNRYVPMQLDVGTNNKALLDDPLYMGWRHERVSGRAYDDFIEQFVYTLKKHMPHVLLHWEDFGRDNARKNLLTYRKQICSFNDDMQGTGAVVLACLLAAMKGLKQPLSEQRIVVYGAGTAGCGIADQIRDAMVVQGLSEVEANNCFYLIDREGVLSTDMDGLLFFQEPYAQDWTGPKDLLSVVKQVKPTILIGASGQAGHFTEEVVKAMYEHCAHPIILPLSNPTDLAEAKPTDLMAWTEGNVLMATGSPFEPVDYQGREYVVAQSNNAFVFPGLGLGSVAAKAKEITNAMLFAACDELSNHAPVRHDIQQPLLPDLEDARTISRHIAIAVAEQACKEGVAGVAEDASMADLVKQKQWEPTYYPIKGV